MTLIPANIMLREARFLRSERVYAAKDLRLIDS